MASGGPIWQQKAKAPVKVETETPLKTSGMPEPRHESATPVLVETAQAEDVATRIQGLEGLAQTEPMQHIDTFMGALADPMPEIRETAADILSRLDPAVVSNKTVDALCSGRGDEVARVDSVLPVMKSALEPGMIRVLQDPDQPSLRRQAAAYALGRINSTLAVPVLLQPVFKPDTDLAVTCANALMALHDPMLTPTLVALTRHALPEIRWAAVQTIADLGGPESFEALGHVAIEPPEGDVELGRRAVQLLGATRAPLATPILIEVMRKNLGLRRAAIDALQKLTGQDLGDRPSDWQAWYEASLKTPTTPPPDAQSPFNVELMP